MLTNIGSITSSKRENQNKDTGNDKLRVRVRGRQDRLLVIRGEIPGAYTDDVIHRNNESFSTIPSNSENGTLPKSSTLATNFLQHLNFIT